MRPCQPKFPSSNNWPYYSGGGKHNGLDFQCPRGSQVFAMRPGKVVDSSSNTKGWAGIYAVTIQVGANEKDIYAHLKSNSVTVGETVVGGDEIGRSGGQPGGRGSTEGHSTGNHLHVSTLKGSSSWVDPNPAIKWKSGSALPPADPNKPGAPGTTPAPAPGTPGPGGTTVTQATQYGNFEEATKLIKIDDLRRALFNPSMCEGTRLHRLYPELEDATPVVGTVLTGDRKLGRGWIVRDPAAAVGIGENPSTTEPASTVDEDGDGTPDPLRGAESVVIKSAYEAYGPGSANYGFRFLMNPETHSENYSTVQGQDIAGYLQDLQYTNNPPVVTATGVSMSFSLLLDRQLDFWMYAHHGRGDLDWVKHAYEFPPISTEIEELFKYGTMYDMEYLFRTCNGQPMEGLWHGKKTADFGVFAPYPVIISLGNAKRSRRIRGSITGFSINHSMFAPGMIPIRTEVQVQVMRISDSYYQNPDMEAEPVTPSDPAEPADPGNPGSPNTGKGPKSVINFSGGLKGTSEYGHKVHAAVASAYPWTDKTGTFGTYASGGNHGNGRALDIMLPKNPRTSANKGWQIARFLKDNWRNLAVTQVIWQQQIWTTERSREGWRAYGDHGDDTSNHWDHVHVSFGPGSGNDDFSQKLHLTSSQEYWRNH